MICSRTFVGFKLVVWKANFKTKRVDASNEPKLWQPLVCKLHSGDFNNPNNEASGSKQYSQNNLLQSGHFLNRRS